MNRFLSVVALCLLSAACNSSSKNNNNENAQITPFNNGLDPTAMVLEVPPTNGKLPADLLPPG